MIIPKAKIIVFLGGGNLLLSLAKWCAGIGFEVKIITSPRFLHEKVENNKKFEEALLENNLPHIVKNKLYDQDFYDFVGELNAPFYLSIAAPWIFKRSDLQAVFKDRLFNLHGTRLPQGRGGAPISWQIMMGIRLGYCQLHKVAPGIDNGEIIATKEFLYPSSARLPRHFYSVYDQQNLLFMQEILHKVFYNQVEVTPVPQLEYLSSYFPRLNTDTHGWVDWTLRCDSLERFICAFDDPYPGAKTLLNGHTVHLRDVMIDRSDQLFHEFQYGMIYRTSKNWINICVNGASLLVSELTDSNGNDILSQVQTGDRFITPFQKLEESKNRIFYTT